MAVAAGALVGDAAAVLWHTGGLLDAVAGLLDDARTGADVHSTGALAGGRHDRRPTGSALRRPAPRES